MRIPRIFLVALLASISVSVSGATAQTDWLLYRNVDPRFRFLYPPEWRLGTTRGANVRATLFPPLDAPSANCNVVVRPEPELSGIKQHQLNEMIQSAPLEKDEWAQMMGVRWPDLVIIQSTHTKVHNQPAYFSVVEFSSETVDRKIFIRGMQVATFTPGYVWHFSCAGRGATLQAARNSYKHWETTFRRMAWSLVFENW